MLPALNPTQTALSEGKRSTSPDSRMWWARYRESPPFTSRTSVSSTRGTQSSLSSVGSAVSSSTPRDFHPSSHMGVVACPVMNRYAPRMPPGTCPYDAVGMQRASHSAIGLPSSSSIASLMLGFLMPAEVRRNFKSAPSLARVRGGLQRDSAEARKSSLADETGKR